MKVKRYSLPVSVILVMVAVTAAIYAGCGSSGDGNDIVTNGVVIDHSSTDALIIPAEYINAAKSSLHIAYQHTSHGSQIISGMDTIAAYTPFGTRYEWGSTGLDLNDCPMTDCADLSQGDSEDANGDTPWVIATRQFLDNTDNYHINVIIWSWCSINGHNIDRYISNMEKLIGEYSAGGTNTRAALHPVEFVFMTGHAEGQAEDGFVAQAALKIRNHCVANNRWLIDYYDIECYDPDGVNYGDRNIYDNLNYDGGNWAVEYLSAHDGSTLDILTTGDGGSFPGCTSCAHSETPVESKLNCVLKGQAAWSLFARMAGWGNDK